MNKRQFRNWLLIIMIHTIICLFSFLWLLQTKESNGMSAFTQEDWVIKVSILSILLLAWTFFSWYILTKRYIIHYTMFVVSLFIFHFGQLWVVALGWTGKMPVDIMSTQPHNSIYYAAVYSFSCICLFHLGAIISLITIIPHRKKLSDNKLTDNSKVIFITGMLLLFVSVVPMLINDYKGMDAAIKGGYLDVYKISYSGTFGFIFIILGKLYFPGIVFAIVGLKDSKVVWKMLFFISVFYEVVKMFIIGNRGAGIFFILALMWIKHIVIKRYTKKDILKLSIACFAILILSSFIQTIRLEARQEILSMNIITLISEENLLFKSVAEFGGTLITVVLVMRFVPSYLSYGNGITYLSSSLVLLPNVGGVLNWVGDYVSYSVLLNQFVKGLGGSFIGETYYNFGLYGIVACAFFGFLLGKYTKWLIDAINQNKLFGCALAAVFIPPLLWLVRDQFYSITSGIMMNIIYPSILYYIVYIYLKSKRKIV